MMIDKFEVTKLLTKRPEHELSNKVKECYDILDELKIDYQLVEYNRPPQDKDEMLLVDEILEVPGIKNLVFITKNKKKLFFVVLARDKTFDIKAFREKHGITKIEMVKEEVLQELLNTSKGSVSIMELIHDKENKIELFIDEEIFKGKYFRFHPNENSATVRVTLEDFENKIIPYLKHEINII